MGRRSGVSTGRARVRRVVILVDSSLWIEVLRGASTPATRRLRAVIGNDPSSVATTEPIMMELLAGATGEERFLRVSDLLASMTLVRLDPARDFNDAATLFRSARTGGSTIRSLMDFLIAAVAIRSGSTLWHRDTDYEVIAQFAPLETLDLR